MKNLLLSFSSFLVDSDPSNEREKEYAVCYEQLLRVTPSGFNIVFVDNTIKSKEDIQSERLKKTIGHHETIFYNDNLGESNKGLGELDMLIKASDTLNFKDYKTISYLTGRRIVTCSYIFERVNSLEKEALISNPPLINVMNGKVHPTNSTCYNDMFFSMKPNTMIKYCNFSKKIIKNSHTKEGSEQNLYNFINQNKIPFEWMEYLGFIRNDWEMLSDTYNKDLNNMQFC
jgi:hypothetical protein